jgi:ubiquinone/menaquinone biosynthesis C-methylase UbiE
MKNSFPKKSFSGFDKNAPRKTAGTGYGKTSGSRYEKSDRSERPAPRGYTPHATYGADSKSSSYRGKNFRSESVDKEVSRPAYAPREEQKTFSSSPSSSPISYYGDAKKTNASPRTERPERLNRVEPNERSRYTEYAKRAPASSGSKSMESKKATATDRKPKAVPSDTSWGGVAGWYDSHLEKSGDTYHEKVVYPNLLRILGDIKGKRILDLACGQGQFSRLMRDEGAYITGVDLGKELIAIAEAGNKSVKETGTHKATYFSGSADDLYMLKDASFDTVVCVLALQNIENLKKTIEEADRVLVKGGSFIFVLNHPMFRNTRHTHWGYDESHNVQYRRVDEYMSESHVKIDMTPGSATKKKFTVSFHRPLQVYVKALSKQGLLVNRLEEWVSHRVSEKGPKKHAEDVSRKEIPLFMCIEAVKG